MTITSTQLGSTSILDNHKPQDSYSYVRDEKDDTYSQYKPSPDWTKDYNLDSQVNCGILSEPVLTQLRITPDNSDPVPTWYVPLVLVPPRPRFPLRIHPRCTPPRTMLHSKELRSRSGYFPSSSSPLVLCLRCPHSGRPMSFLRLRDHPR